MTHKLKLLVGICLTCMSVFGQSTSGEYLKSVEIRPLPTAASLGKYGEYPVNLSTGVPSISIPLFNIETRRLTIPISLDYHASGVKVQEYASWVGLGFSLHAGGAITRVLKGRPDDEGTNGYLDQLASMPLSNDIDLSDPNDLTYMENLVDQNTIDAEPDIFQLTLPGLSCSFYFKNHNEVVTSPSLPIKIKFFRPNGGLNYFVVTDPAGNSYEFKTREWSVSSKGFEGNFISAWYLTKMLSYDKSDQIDFSYKTHGVSLPSTTSYTLNFYHHLNNGPGIPHINNQIENVQSSSTISSDSVRKLMEIKWNNGRVEFISSPGRPDLSGEYKLDTIKFYSKDCLTCSESFLNEYALSFFTNYGSRLMLQNIQQFSVNKSIPPYEFEYYLPSSTSALAVNAQDHWGYYNGKSNSTLIPQGTYHFSITPITLGNADRETDENVIRFYSLKKIKYPTRGYTIFDTEANTVNYQEPILRQEEKTVSTNIETGVFSNSIQFTLTAIPNGSTLYSQFVSYSNVQAFLSCCNTELRCAATLTFRNITKDITVTINSSNDPDGLTQQDLNNFDIGDEIQLSVSVDSRCAYAEGVNFNLDAILTLKNQYVDGYQTISKKVGGLRIKEVVNYDANNTVINRKNYIYEQPELLDVPKYDNSLRLYNNCFIGGGGGGGSDCDFAKYDCFTLNGQSIAGSSGNVVAYQKVSEIFGTLTSNIGKRVSQFSIVHDGEVATDQFIVTIPFNTLSNRLLTEKTFDSNGILVQSDSNSYVDQVTSTVRGLKASRRIIYTNVWSSLDIIADAPYVYRDYQYSTYWSYLSSTTKKIYGPGGVSTTITNNFYDNPSHQQLTRQILSGSKSETVINENKYAQDVSPVTPIIQKMIDDNLVSLPIEKITSTVQGANTYQKSHDRFTYQNISGVVVPLKLERALNGGTMFTEFLINQYDSKYNIVQVQTAKDPVKSYIWKYGSTLPVAVATNAAINKILYEGFEDDAINTTSVSKTGKRGYAASYNVILPSPGTYRLSYWRKVGAGPWELVETSVSSNTLIGGADIVLDEIRLYPATAQIVTYSHRPNVGITSMTDMNNRTTYFEFDDFQRFHSKKDENRSIVNVVDYNYKTN